MPILPIIMALLGGQSLGAIVAGFSMTQWVAIAEELIGAAPSVIQDFSALHPALARLAGLIAKGLSAKDVAAAQYTTFQQWAAANPDAPYYKSDGTVARAGG